LPDGGFFNAASNLPAGAGQASSANFSLFSDTGICGSASSFSSSHFTLYPGPVSGN
jgi:hypothetical protein